MIDDPSTLTESEPLRASVLYPGRLLQEMTTEFGPAAVRKGLEFKAEPYLDWHDVIGDEAKVRQIVARLLANAITHTPEGWVRLAVTPPDGQHWSVIVEDTGPGISPKEVAHVFEAFPGAPGTGPGLSASRTLADRLGGKLSLRSVAGRGTRCEVRLPVMLRHS